jgi:hypothetical protein
MECIVQFLVQCTGLILLPYLTQLDALALRSVQSTWAQDESCLKKREQSLSSVYARQWCIRSTVMASFWQKESLHCITGWKGTIRLPMPAQTLGTDNTFNRHTDITHTAASKVLWKKIFACSSSTLLLCSPSPLLPSYSGHHAVVCRGTTRHFRRHVKWEATSTLASGWSFSDRGAEDWKPRASAGMALRMPFASLPPLYSRAIAISSEQGLWAQGNIGSSTKLFFLFSFLKTLSKDFFSPRRPPFSTTLV